MAENLELNHKFNEGKEPAEYDWLNMFLKRHPDLECENQKVPEYEYDRNWLVLSIVVAEISRETMSLLNKLKNIFNINETGLCIIINEQLSSKYIFFISLVGP